MLSMLLLLSRLLVLHANFVLDPAKDFKILVHDLMYAQENLCFFVPCSFSYPDQYPNNSIRTGSWFRVDKDSPICSSNLTAIVDDEFKNRTQCHMKGNDQECSFSIDPITVDDMGLFYFVANIMGQEVRFIENVTLLVKEKMDLEIQILPVIEVNRNTTIICSVPWTCEWEKKPRFIWTTRAQAHFTVNRNFSSELIINPQMSDHGETLTCTVLFVEANVKLKKSVTLNVTEVSQDGQKRFPKNPDDEEEEEDMTTLWVFLIVAAIVEAFIMALLGAFLERHFHTKVKPAPQPVKSTGSAAAGSPSNDSPSRSTQRHLDQTAEQT